VAEEDPADRAASIEREGIMTESPYQAAIAAFDQANGEDPNQERHLGRAIAKELLYSHRMGEMQERYAPEASEAVRLAVRAQHIQRWKVARSEFPVGRQGYLQWRTRLYSFHAQTAGDLMRQAGYDEEMVGRVMAIVSKKGLKVNPATQLMEDVGDLVFLEHYMSDFVAKHPEYDEEKWLQIIGKTWRKMSPRAHEFALSGRVRLPGALAPLVLKAVKA
jgi:hypothetical protein